MTLLADEYVPAWHPSSEGIVPMVSMWSTSPRTDLARRTPTFSLALGEAAGFY